MMATRMETRMGRRTTKIEEAINIGPRLSSSSERAVERVQEIRGKGFSFYCASAERTHV